jgi:molybdate/tungstate transport system substrate-binding protein
MHARHPRHPRAHRSLGPVLLIALACARGDGADRRDTTKARANDGSILVYNAAAIARPMRAVLDSFHVRTGIAYTQETAASLELARRVLELGGEPDVMALADPEIFPQLLEPRFATWHALFARNRIVLAYSPRSRGADEVTAENWFKVLARPGVEVGRADPHTDPSGYRTLLVWQLAERYYREPGLFTRMLRASPPRNIRPREADQVALLQVGEYDYIWTYQNLAENAGLRYVKLPDAVDLGEPADSATYALASVRVLGKAPGDSLTLKGKPILFAVTVPTTARHREGAEKFVEFLLSADGRRILRGQRFDALEAPVVLGTGAPAWANVAIRQR